MLESPSFVRAFSSRELGLLRLLVFCLFIGRAWQGLFWDLPLRTFFWDQMLLEGVVTTLTGDTWQNYVTNKSVNIDAFINGLGAFLGFFWGVCAVLALVMKKEWKWVKWIYYVAIFSLIVLALLYYKDKFFATAQFFEYALQVFSPLMLLHVIYGGQNTIRFRWWVKIAIAITFFSHGLYAYGYYEPPSAWVQWCVDIFHFQTDAAAKQFLVVMGVLDFLVAGLIFVPITFSVVIWYCIIWGFLTAFARIVGNFYVHIPWESLHQYTYETSFRLVHGGIPLLMWYWNKEAVPKTGS